MTLTPEERQRVYEEEKARREAQDRLDAERGQKRGVGCLPIVGGLIVLGIILSAIGSLMKPSDKTPSSSTDNQPSPVQGRTNEAVLKDIVTMTGALHDMKVELAGQSMDHVKFVLEIFDGAARLIQTARLRQLADQDSATVAALRKALVARQRQTFPIIRDRAGPIFSKELWMSDVKARTSGDRFTTIEFVAADFVANANIAKAHGAILGALTRMRFKRAQYKWHAEQDEYSYYKIESPRDGDIAIIDLEGHVMPVPK